MIRFLKHLLIPHKKNKHRAKILHHSSLFLIIIFLFGVTFTANYLKKTNPDVLGVSYSMSTSELLTLVNAQRQSNGLPALTDNPELDDAARRKAADMFAKNYWAHFAPDGSTSPWQFIRDAGYNYSFAGENLAKGFTDGPSVVTAWMNSPSHRKNILNDKYREIGFAIVPGTLQGEDTVLVVQMFGSTSSSPVALTKTAATEQVQGQSITPLPTAIPTPSTILIKTASLQDKNTVINKPKIDAAISSKAASTAGLTFLAFGFLLDLMVVERKKIPRVVGHNLDHIMLIVTFILFLIIMRGGVIV